jgi:phage portal protein BeeE
MSLIRSLIAPPASTPVRREAMTFDEWTGLFSMENMWPLVPTTMTGEREDADTDFPGLVYGAYLRNSVVFSCLALRARLFSEMRFQFQQLRGGRPGNLFGTAALTTLENPEPGKTTGDLLAMAILDADLAGNAFLLGRPDGIYRLRPDWTTIVWASKSRSSELGTWDPEARILGYGYTPGGPGSGEQSLVYGPDEVAHFAPTRDPLARNRGISLLVAGLREIMGDNAATSHKLRFFSNAATPNLALKLPAGMSREKATEWIELFEQEHRGSANAYRTLYFGGGMEAAPVGLNFQEMTFTELQGKAETRIAALTGVHPVVVALSEGLQGSSLNSGNFQSAARLVGNGTLRPLWRNVSGSMQTIVRPLPGTRLWYDDRDVHFLQADIKDRADVIQAEATTIKTLVDNGWQPASVIDAVTADGDWGRLQHSGLTSVQLQPPLTGPSAITPPPAAFRARVTFVAGGGPTDAKARVNLGGLEDQPVEAGSIVEPDSPLVRAFPSLFEPEVSSRRQAATRSEVLRARNGLLAAGRDAGFASVARELHVSTDTVRRRLATQEVR